MLEVVSKYIDKVSKEEIEQVNALTDLTWPATKPKKFTSDSRLIDFHNRNPSKTCHFIHSNENVVGYAESFPRDIGVNQQILTILGLGAVCVHPTFRGKGLGAQLVRAAFSRIDIGEYPVSLFQTGVPGFYELLNCRTIDNRIINSHGNDPLKNPFWDPHVMIYPSQFVGFQSEIDLLGPGY